ncbi:glycosyltransferase family 2 protein [Mycolicibacterium cosmeticum]|uniref:glycosyltransferase family 2 protein n=1 Tax=Mycolicibacterium cosmeticum TaxID=258533 RepID=UPI003204EDCA
MTEISIVIPCRDGADTLPRQIDAILAQSTDIDFEVVVADNGSVDGTAAVVRGYANPRVRLADASRAAGVNVARNVGVSAAHGGFIMLTDADDVVHDGWLEAYARAFRRGAQLVGGGLDCALPDGRLLRRERRLYRALLGRYTYANGTNCGFTRAVFDDVGGFDESFSGGADEVDFFCRAADARYKLEFVPDAVVTKIQPDSLRDVFARQFKFGRGEARLLRKHRPLWLCPAIPLALLQAAMWSLVWLTGIRRRTSTAGLAFSLGLMRQAVPTDLFARYHIE